MSTHNIIFLTRNKKNIDTFLMKKKKTTQKTPYQELCHVIHFFKQEKKLLCL